MFCFSVFGVFRSRRPSVESAWLRSPPDSRRTPTRHRAGCDGAETGRGRLYRTLCTTVTVP